MKRLHRRDLFAWSAFNERLDIDFNSFLLTRAEGNLAIDPLPLSEHDTQYLRTLGGLSWIVVTNSAHVRAAGALRSAFGAKVAGPAAEREGFPIQCDRWLGEGDALGRGVTVHLLEGSKTAGELALRLDPETLVFGDLVRCHRAGSLTFLRAAQGLKDLDLARASVGKLVTPQIETVLVGDGYSIFRDGQRALAELLAPGARSISDAGTS